MTEKRARSTLSIAVPPLLSGCHLSTPEYLAGCVALALAVLVWAALAVFVVGEYRRHRRDNPKRARTLSLDDVRAKARRA